MKIRTERAVTEVPPEKSMELLERLRFAGRDDIAERLRSSQMFAEADKRFVFELLDGWLNEVKIHVFGQQLMDLRLELDWDLGNR